MSTRTFVCPACSSRLVRVRREGYPMNLVRDITRPTEPVTLELLVCTCERCRHTWNEKPSGQEET